MSKNLNCLCKKKLNNLYLKSFIRCKRKAWLDSQGNKSQKIWSPHQSIEIINQYKTFYKLSDGDLYSGTKAVSYTHLTLPTTPYV